MSSRSFRTQGMVLAFGFRRQASVQLRIRVVQPVLQFLKTDPCFSCNCFAVSPSSTKSGTMNGTTSS